jgi:hypothetical protein
VTRHLVVASRPDLCAVCAGSRRLRLVAGTNPLTGAQPGSTTRCPHCTDGIPIVHLPWRSEPPRGVA